MSGLSDYYFLHDELLVIPIEQLSPTGVDPAFDPLLRTRVSAEWIALFNEAFAIYWQQIGRAHV